MTRREFAKSIAVLLGLTPLLTANQETPKSEPKKRSSFEYNGILIEQITGVQIEMSPRFDEDFYLYTRYSIRVRGVVNSENNTPEEIKRRLEMPRKPMRLSVYTHLMIDIEDESTIGIEPQSAQVSKITSKNGLWIVDCGYQVKVNEEIPNATNE
jgi:hypothetical protein